jgi:hypothetical protein
MSTFKFMKQFNGLRLSPPPAVAQTSSPIVYATSPHVSLVCVLHRQKEDLARAGIRTSQRSRINRLGMSVSQVLFGLGQLVRRRGSYKIDPL